MTDAKKFDEKTRLLHEGRVSADHHGAVNPPIYHASTFLFESYKQLLGKAPFPKHYYGRHTTPTSAALEDAITMLEGGYKTVLTPSGLNACAIAMMAFVAQGDHLLISDSAYEPSRDFCDYTLARIGVEVTRFNPAIGADIESLITPKTKVIFMEAPGSQTMEIPDLKGIIKIAQAHNITTMLDNTWATPVYFKPLEIGINISIQAATKYIIGHADALMGTICCDEQSYDQLRKTHRVFGLCAGADDVRLALRGLRTLNIRLKHHEESALEIAKWLEKQSIVKQVLHPALESFPFHNQWKDYFSGASGLFSFIIPHQTEDALCAMLDDMDLFGMGFSWGGFESLIMPYPRIKRATDAEPPDGLLIRLHIGLEDVEDLKQDLTKAFERLQNFTPA